AEILQDRSEPGAFAAETYLRVLAQGHRYGVPQGGTEATVRALTREHVLQAHGLHHRGIASRLAVVGDVKAEDIRRRVEDLFGAFDGGFAPRTDPPPPPDTGRTSLHFVDLTG